MEETPSCLAFHTPKHGTGVKESATGTYVGEPASAGLLFPYATAVVEIETGR